MIGQSNSGVSRVHDLWTSIKAIAWFVGAAGFLLGAAILVGLSPVVLVLLLVLAVAVAIIYIIAKKLLGKRAGLPSFIRATLASMFALTIVCAAPIVIAAFYGQLNPLVVPQATLTNGDKTVVFQGMSHIGSEDFYKGVVYDLEKALMDGYVLYYEGVNTGSQESQEWFNNVMAGGKDLSANYSAIAEACGLTFQLDYFDVVQSGLETDPEHHVRADIDTLEFQTKAEELAKTDTALRNEIGKRLAESKQPKTAEGEDAGEMLTVIRGLNKRQRNIAGIFCRAYMSYVLGHPSGDDPMRPVILDYRNEELAKRIAADPRERIFITYGAHHFSGLLKDLKDVDPAWHVASVKWLRTIEPPDEVQGQLPED